MICEDCEPELAAAEEKEVLAEKIEPEFRPLEITTGKPKPDDIANKSGRNSVN